ncbi:unnamed protein product [Penicillium olsonii]|nr:unnamed protein product [Penicillium olsonii]
MAFSDVDKLAINTIRTLAVDATFNANSGHPGAPMGMAPAAHVPFNRFLSFNPRNPDWINRDRFVLSNLVSNGHGCMLQYALLHLCGYDLSMDDIKSFRQLHSKTPGHPESHETPGVEVTTGPLGQGFANAVGLAIAQAHLAGVFNKPGFDLITNRTFYGDIECTFTEDVQKRFEAYGWHVEVVTDGNNDLDAIEKAIQKCIAVTDKPSMIKVATTIGFGSKLEGTSATHGNPLKKEDVENVKKQFGFDPSQSFFVPQTVYDLYAQHAKEGIAKEQEWIQKLNQYAQEYPAGHGELIRRAEGRLPDSLESELPVYTSSDAAVASRKLSETVLEKINKSIPELISGSADLTSSNNTRWKDAVDFQPPEYGIGEWSGRYIRYGVREHAMAAIMNGLAAYGMIIPLSGGFLNFVAYGAGAVRLAALSRLRVIHVATHDSIALGQDGPTHQPIEALTHYRAMPNCMVWRPADGNETSAAYLTALQAKNTPSILALTRQNLPQLEGSSISKAMKGGYVVLDTPDATITLISTGSEVNVCLQAAVELRKQNVAARVVSVPCFEVFDQQEESYRLQVLPDGIPILSVEAATTMGWERYSHQQFGINRFGASAPPDNLFAMFELTSEGVAKRAIATISFYAGGLVVPKQTVLSPIRRAFLQIQ